MVRRWDRWKNPWDREYAKRGRLWRGQATVEPIPEFVRPPARVLDVGCGDGKFVVALARAGYSWVGLDFSRHALRLLPEDGDRVLGDARRLPFREDAFAVVAARYTLGALRIKDRERMARELGRVCQEDGIILVEEFSEEDFRFGKGTPVEEATFERNAGLWTHYFSEPEMKLLIPGRGLLRLDVVRRPLRILGRNHQRVSLRAVFGSASNVSSGSGA